MTTFVVDLIHALIAALFALLVAAVGVLCIVIVAGALWLFTGWLSNLIASTDDLARAGLSVGILALLFILAMWRRSLRGRAR